MTKVAFVDIDTQFDFMNPKGNLYVPGAVDIVPNLKKLIAHAKDHYIPIVGSVDAHAENDPEFKIYPPHCVKGTDGQKKIPETTLPSQRIIAKDKKVSSSELMPPGPVILEKTVYSMFDNPNADEALKLTGAKRFYLFGVALDICVKHAAEGLLERGYEIAIITDATAPVSYEKGEETLNNLKSRGARLVTTAEVLKETP
jgi:nicotinamidase/pyrazinamidase